MEAFNVFWKEIGYDLQIYVFILPRCFRRMRSSSAPCSSVWTPTCGPTPWGKLSLSCHTSCHSCHTTPWGWVRPSPWSAAGWPRSRSPGTPTSRRARPSSSWPAGSRGASSTRRRWGRWIRYKSRQSLISVLFDTYHTMYNVLNVLLCIYAWSGATALCRAQNKSVYQYLQLIIYWLSRWDVS